jgi:7-cyano-7-deazaguanine synthase
VATGLAWEAAELQALGRLLAAPVFRRRVEPLVRLEFEMRDIYTPSHWAIVGTPPDYDTPDEDVYLPGRNIVLLSKAAVFAATRGLHSIRVAWLSGNPFPDASPAFVRALERALSIGLAHDIRIEAPFAALGKADVIRRGLALGVPLEQTLSCMRPLDGRHCGLCSKCRERRDAFEEAGLEDRTAYVNPSPRTVPRMPQL